MSIQVCLNREINIEVNKQIIYIPLTIFVNLGIICLLIEVLIECFKDFIYLLKGERKRESMSRVKDRRRSRLSVEQGVRCGAPIPGQQDHDLSRRLN